MTVRDTVGRATPVELSADPRFGRRVRRLAAVATVALGIIWALGVTTLAAPPIIDASLAAGWVSMPAVLLASLGRPALRYALVVPASLVGVALLAVCAAWLPSSPTAVVGWVSITAGIAFGGWLGLWFWYRMLPVPASLDDPFSPARWGLIAVHVALIVVGLLLASSPLFSP